MEAHTPKGIEIDFCPSCQKMVRFEGFDDFWTCVVCGRTKEMALQAKLEADRESRRNALQKFLKILGGLIVGLVGISVVGFLLSLNDNNLKRIFNAGANSLMASLVIGAVIILILLLVTGARFFAATSFWRLSKSNRFAHLSCLLATLCWSALMIFILFENFEIIEGNSEFALWIAVWSIPILVTWLGRFFWLARLKAVFIKLWSQASQLSQIVLFSLGSWILAFPLSAFFFLPETLESSDYPERLFFGLWLFVPFILAFLVFGYSRILRKKQ